MGWYSTVFEMIDMRSFSNLWYWIVLAVLWSTASHWVLGVPYDMVERARRKGGQAEQDLEQLTRINVNRVLFIAEETGVFLTALTCAFFTMMALLGFVYRIEFAQALFLLLFPMVFVALLTLSSARKIHAGANQGQALWKRLRLHRTYTQMIGVFSIFVAAFWGMTYNMPRLAF
jgi:hypothetical protein